LSIWSRLGCLTDGMVVPGWVNWQSVQQPGRQSGRRHATDEDNCEVCLIAPRNPRVALVPCGHQRFCIDCANRVHDQGRWCPICRADITIVLTLYWHSAYCTELNCSVNITFSIRLTRIFIFPVYSCLVFLCLAFSFPAFSCFTFFPFSPLIFGAAFSCLVFSFLAFSASPFKPQAANFTRFLAHR